MLKRVETIYEAKLPVDEILRIKRCRYLPKNLKESEIRRLPRLSVVTGIHGDELEGQYTCFQLARILQENPQHLTGVLDIYPAVNTLGIDSITRGFPNFELDMNRIFPGAPDRQMVERLAGVVVDSLAGSDLVLDIHASNIFLRELPQARINENTATRLTGLASLLNLDFLWIHPSTPVLESTLAHSLNSIDTPCIVVEMGVGMRITPQYTDQLVSGILDVMRELGVWNGEKGKEEEVSRRPMLISPDRQVIFINAKTSGIFVPSLGHCGSVQKDQVIGRIIDPLEGLVREELLSPCAGLVFTLREYPLVYTGSLVARIMEGGVAGEKGNPV